MKSLKGNYSLQARLLPGPPAQQEVTGIGGNTTQANFCAQVSELNALGYGAGSARWYMIQAVRDHEEVHAAHFGPALSAAAPQISTDVQALSVPDNGQSEADAINEIRALAAFATVRSDAQQLWLAEILILAANDHNGPTDAAEHAVVDPMIAAICNHANANNWGACAAC